MSESPVEMSTGLFYIIKNWSSFLEIAGYTDYVYYVTNNTMTMFSADQVKEIAWQVVQYFKTNSTNSKELIDVIIKDEKFKAELSHAILNDSKLKSDLLNEVAKDMIKRLAN